MSQICPVCGGDPIGIGCYHICPNSDHYYTPERERQDEANYDPSEYYREAGFADPDPYYPGEEDE